MENLDDVVIVAATDGRILHANGVASRVLGFAPEAFRTMHARDIHPAEFRTQADTILAETIASGKARHSLPLVTADGHQLHAQGRTWTGVWDGKSCVVCICKDTSAVVDANVWFEGLFRNNPTPMALTSSDDRIFLDVNDAYVSATGYEREEILGRTPSDLDLVVEVDTYAAAAAQLRSYGHIKGIEIHVRRKDGQILTGLIYGEALNTKRGRVVLTLMVDITEMRRAEAALAHGEERFRLTLEAVNDGVWDWDIPASKGTWNARSYTMLGYENNAFPITFQSWVDLIHPNDRKRALAAIERSLRDARSFSTEFRLRRKDGTWLWVLGRGRPVAWNESGEPIRAVGTNTDIDDRIRLEQSLIEARLNAEAADQAKSEFLANMSHELRTPLNSVIGFSSMLLDPNIGKISDARTLEYLQIIQGSGQHLLDIIDDVLDLSAIEAGQIELEDTSMDVLETCETCVSMTRPIADWGGVCVSVTIPETTPILRADARRVRQVVLNMVSNAIKFTRNGGDVTVSCRREDDGRLSLVVTDTGIGIDPSHLKDLMKPFGQAESVYARRAGGAGLGLPLTARLMELHGGTLTLESKPGEGTTAVATFPAFRVLRHRPGR